MPTKRYDAPTAKRHDTYTTLPDSFDISSSLEYLVGADPKIYPLVEEAFLIESEINKLSDLVYSDDHNEIMSYLKLIQILNTLLNRLKAIDQLIERRAIYLEEDCQTSNPQVLPALLNRVRTIDNHLYIYLLLMGDVEETNKDISSFGDDFVPQFAILAGWIKELQEELVVYLNPNLIGKSNLLDLSNYSFRLIELKNPDKLVGLLTKVATVYKYMGNGSPEPTPDDLTLDETKSIVLHLWASLIRMGPSNLNRLTELAKLNMIKTSFDRKLPHFSYRWLVDYLNSARHVLNSIYEQRVRMVTSDKAIDTDTLPIDIYRRIISDLLRIPHLSLTILAGCGIVDAFTLWQACRVVDDPRLANELAIRAREAGIFVQRPVDWIEGSNDSSGQGDDFFVLAIRQTSGLKKDTRLSAGSFQELFRKPIDEVVITNDGRTLLLTFNSRAERFWFEIKHDAKRNEVNFDWSCTLPLNPDTFANYREFFLSCAGIAQAEATQIKTSRAQKSGRGEMGSSSDSRKILPGQQRTPEQKAKEKAEAKARPAVEVAELVRAERKNGLSEMQHILLNHDDIAKICQESGVQESVVTKITQKIDETFNRKDPVLSEFKKIVATKVRINLFRLDVGRGYRAIFTQATGEDNITKWLLVDFDRRDSVYKPETVANLADKASRLLEKYNRQQQIEEKK